MSPTRDQIERAADALQARAAWPSLHWPNIDGVQHRDVAIALASAALTAASPDLEGNDR